MARHAVYGTCLSRTASQTGRYNPSQASVFARRNPSSSGPYGGRTALQDRGARGDGEGGRGSSDRGVSDELCPKPSLRPSSYGRKERDLAQRISRLARPSAMPDNTAAPRHASGSPREPQSGALLTGLRYTVYGALFNPDNGRAEDRSSSLRGTRQL